MQRHTSLTLFALGLLPASVMAHPGHEVLLSADSWIAHPFSEPDHLLAMLTAGLVTGILLRKAGVRWVASLAGAGIAGAGAAMLAGVI